MTTLAIIDDEQIVVDWIKTAVEKAEGDYRIVATAYNGIRGLALLRQLKPDIVITDIRIPGMDGLSLIENTMEELPQTAYIVISGYRDFSYARKALQLRVLDYVDKPITEDKLYAALSTAVNYLKEKKFAHLPENASLEECGRQCQQITEEIMRCIREENGERMLTYVQRALADMEQMQMELERYQDECVKDIYVAIEVMKERVPQFELRKNIVPYTEMKQLRTKQEVRLYTVEIFKEFAYGIQACEGMTKNKAIQALLAYIDEHFAEDIGLKELADYIKMNPAYLSMLFKERVGMSYVKYLTKIRMDKAKELLRDGEKVTEVSIRVGYNDYRYFSQVFKKNENMTPNEYKEMYRK